MPNRYIMTKNEGRKSVLEGMKSARQISENQKTRNKDSPSYDLTSVLCQLRKQNKTKNPKTLSLSTETVLRCSNIEKM